jgi:hypothetical protein
MDAKIAWVHLRGMKLLVLLAILAAGCQRSAEHAAAPGYADDIRKLCNVMQLSGADAATADQRQLLTANWLSKNLTTAESHEFLVKIQPLDNESKAQALEREAARVEVGACPLAAEWRK